jgi:hypothetical protein
MFRAAIALSLILVASVAVCSAGEDPVALEIATATAKAEASVAIAKATVAQKCSAVECTIAAAKADRLVTEAVKQLSPKGATLSADGRTLTDADGATYVRQANGTFLRSDPGGDGCRIINGQNVCPTPKR